MHGGMWRYTEVHEIVKCQDMIGHGGESCAGVCGGVCGGMLRYAEVCRRVCGCTQKSMEVCGGAQRDICSYVEVCGGYAEVFRGVHGGMQR